jgi:hypothetical protein
MTAPSDPPEQELPPDDPLVLQLCRRLKAMIPSCAVCRRAPTLACALRTLGRDIPVRRVPAHVRRRLETALRLKLGI